MFPRALPHSPLTSFVLVPAGVLVSALMLSSCGSSDAPAGGAPSSSGGASSAATKGSGASTGPSEQGGLTVTSMTFASGSATLHVNGPAKATFEVTGADGVSTPCETQPAGINPSGAAATGGATPYVLSCKVSEKPVSLHAIAGDDANPVILQADLNGVAEG